MKGSDKRALVLDGWIYLSQNLVVFFVKKTECRRFIFDLCSPFCPVGFKLGRRDGVLGWNGVGETGTVNKLSNNI